MPIANILPFKAPTAPILNPQVHLKNRIIWEQFAVPAPSQRHSTAPVTPDKKAHSTVQVTEIDIPQLNRHILAEPGQSILEAGLASGIDMPHCCQVGGCGECKIILLSGEVKSDEPNCLSGEEAAKGYRLACVSYPMSAIQIQFADQA